MSATWVYPLVLFSLLFLGYLIGYFQIVTP